MKYTKHFPNKQTHVCLPSAILFTSRDCHVFVTKTSQSQNVLSHSGFSGTWNYQPAEIMKVRETDGRYGKHTTQQERELHSLTRLSYT